MQILFYYLWIVIRKVLTIIDTTLFDSNTSFIFGYLGKKLFMHLVIISSNLKRFGPGKSAVDTWELVLILSNLVERWIYTRKDTKAEIRSWQKYLFSMLTSDIISPPIYYPVRDRFCKINLCKRENLPLSGIIEHLKIWVVKLIIAR